jgi:mRNA interferase RelE/StbE
MKHSIKITDLAKRMIEEISDRRIREEIAKRIDKLADDPNLQGKPLKGIFTGYRSVRAVGQRYRIVYKVHEANLIVYVIGAGIRKEGGKEDIYTRLQRLLIRGLAS